MLIAVTVMPIIFDMLTDVPEGVPAHGAPLSALATFLAICAVAVKAKGALRLWAPVIGVVTGFSGGRDVRTVRHHADRGRVLGGRTGRRLAWPASISASDPHSGRCCRRSCSSPWWARSRTIGDSVAIQRVSWRKPWAVDFRAVQGDVANGNRHRLDGGARTRQTPGSSFLLSWMTCRDRISQTS